VIAHVGGVPVEELLPCLSGAATGALLWRLRFMLARLKSSSPASRERANRPYGRDAGELAQVLADLEAIEPLLRRSADLVLTSTAPPAALADRLLEALD